MILRGNLTITTRLVTALSRGKPGRAFLVCIALFGLPCHLFLLAYFALTQWKASWDVVGSVFFAAQWSHVGPLLIWWAETRVIPAFWSDLADARIMDRETTSTLSKRYLHITARPRGLLAACWGLCVVAVFIGSSPFMQSIGMPRTPSTWFFLWCVGVFAFGILTGEGFAGVLMMIQIVLSCVKRPMKLDPYHPDRLGGLSTFGRFAIGATVMFSSGALFLPILVKVAQHSGRGPKSAYLLVTLFVAAVASAFFMPTVLVSTRAKRIKDAMIRNASRGLPSDAGTPEVEKQDTKGLLQVLVRRAILLDICAMGVYPFNPWILSQLGASVLFPLLVLWTQRLLGWN